MPTKTKPKSASTDGQLAARVFRLLDAGNIVTELEERPSASATSIGNGGA